MTQSKLSQKQRTAITREGFKLLKRRADRLLKIPNIAKMNYDDLISIAEEISAIEGNGTLEVKVHNYQVTLFKRHHKTYPKKTK